MNGQRVWLVTSLAAVALGTWVVTRATGGPGELPFWLWANSPHLSLGLISTMLHLRRARWRWRIAASLALAVALFFAFVEDDAMHPDPGRHQSSTSALVLLFGPLWTHLATGVVFAITGVATLFGNRPAR